MAFRATLLALLLAVPTAGPTLAEGPSIPEYPAIAETDCQTLRHPARALAACEELISHYSDWAAPHAVAATIDWYLRNTDGALAEAQKALALAPSEPSALAILAEVTDERGDRRELKTIVARLIGLGGQTFNELMARGLGFYFDRDQSKAFADFDQATALAPSSPFPYVARFRLHRERHEAALAKADLDAAVEKGPDIAFAYIFRARAFAEKDQDRSLADCNKALALDADSPLAYVQRGKIYELRKDYKSALADFDRALKFVPNLSPAHAGRGRVLAAVGDSAAGFKELNLAIQLDPYYRAPFLDRAEVEMRLKQFDEAKKDMDRAMMIHPAHDPRNSEDRLARDRAILTVLQIPPATTAGAQSNITPTPAIADNLPPQMLEPAKVSLLNDIADCVRAVEEAQILSKIAACTRVIATPRVASADLVKAYTMRAAAYRTESKVFYQAGAKPEGAKAIDQSLEDYGKALHLDPGNMTVIQGRYDSEEKKNYPPERLSFDDQKWTPPAPLPKSPDASSAEGLQVLLSERRFDEAIAEATASLKTTASPAYAYGARGEAYLQKAEFEKSVEDLSRAFELEPSNPKWKERLSTALLGQGLHHLRQAQLDQATKDFDWSIKLSPSAMTAAGAYVGKCGIENLKGNFAAALSACDASLKIAPDAAAGYAVRGETYLGLKTLDKAMADLTHAVELDGHNDAAYATRARLFIAQSAFEKAESDIKYALQINPRSASANSLQGTLYLLMRSPKEALTFFAIALETDPHDVAALSGRGWATAVLGDIDGGLRDIDAAIKLDPYHAVAYAWRGSLFLMKGDRDRSAADFEKAMALDRNKAWIITARGEGYLRLKDWALAKRDFDDAIKANPKYEIAYIDRAIYWESSHRYDDALRDLVKASNLNPKNAIVYEARAQLLRRKGDFKDADDFETKAIAIDPRVRDVIRAFDRSLEAAPGPQP